MSEKLHVEYENIREMVEKRAKISKDKIFIAFYGNYLTFGELDEKVNRFANSLIKLGIKKGDVVYIYLQNSPEHLISTLACVKIGAIACPVNTLLKKDEIEYEFNDSGGKAVVTEPVFLPVIDAVKPRTPSLKHVIELADEPRKDNISYKSMLEGSPELKIPSPQRNDYAFIFYTSGTTGKPKGAILTHRNVVFCLAGIREALGPQPGEEIDEESQCALIFLPMFHVNAMMSMLSGIYRGFKIALLRKFSVREFGPTVQRERCTFFSAVPKVYKILLEAKDQVMQYDLSSLKYGVCGAAPMPPDTIREFEKTYGIEILEGYGLTEGTVASTLHRRGGKKKIGSIGQALPGQEVKIFDEEGRELPPGEVGEIWVRGENVMVGYWGKKEETEKTITKDGWLRTGDVGYMDEEGFFYIVDRAKDMIIKGGENIYPKEIEDVISTHPHVHDVAVIGVPDEISGEEVKAFIVPKIGMKIDAEEIINFCKERLADFKVPKYVEFVLALPVNPVGKVLKKNLRKGEGIITFKELETVGELNIDMLFQMMPYRFDKSKAGNWSAVIQYEVYGKNNGEWFLEVKSGEMKASKGKAENPTCIVKTYDLVLKKLVAKEIDGVTAINSGLIQIEGNESDMAMLGEVLTG